MSNARYQQKYYRKKRWLPLDEYIAKKEAAKKRNYPRKAAAAKKNYSRNKSNAVGRAIGSTIGAAIAGAPGSALGAALGGGAQALMRSITGFGDYKVMHNSLITEQDTVPLFKSSKRSTMIYHREFIQDILSSGNFNNVSFPINPALPSTFPWLCEIAEQFEEYRVHGMIFEFKTTSADALNSTNTALGTVILATQYNSLASPFLNKQQMENYEFATSTKPSCSIIHPIECAAFENPTSVLYTRTGVVQNGDLRLYDLGRFNIATVGMQATDVVLGELWVSYAIELLKPRMTDETDVADHFIIPDPDNIDASNYFGFLNSNEIEAQPGSSFGCVLTSGTSVTIPSWFSGNIIVSYQVRTPPSTNAQTGPTITGTQGATAKLMLSNANYQYVSPAGSTGSATMTAVAYFSCVQGGLLTFSGMNLGLVPPDVPLAGDLFISSFSGDLNS